jgi:oligopeptidase B
LGRKWFEDGRLMHKKNTFTDFVDCAQFLVNEKYTSKEKIICEWRQCGWNAYGSHHQPAALTF